MRGSMKQRSRGSWTLILDLGYVEDPCTGRRKRRQQWMTVRGTKRDAETRLNTLLTDVTTTVTDVTATLTDVVNVVDGLLISLVSGLGGTATSTASGAAGTVGSTLG